MISPGAHFSAPMSYIVHCNTARNECVYKMVYGSIVPAPIIVEDPDQTGTSRSGVRRASNGLREIPFGIEDGTVEQLWVCTVLLRS